MCVRVLECPCSSWTVSNMRVLSRGFQMLWNCPFKQHPIIVTMSVDVFPPASVC